MTNDISLFNYKGDIGIITDEVSQADFVRKLLLERSDEVRLLQRILQL